MRVLNRLLIGLAPVALGLGVLSDRTTESYVTRISLLAVGQGDCAVFQTEGKAVLVDAGPRTDSFDSGERIVVPALRRLGVKTLDLVLLSHPDSDHVGGLRALSRRFKIGKVAASACYQEDPSMLACLEEARIDPSEVVWVRRRRTASIGAYRIRLDAPDVSTVGDDNTGSMFVRIEKDDEAVQFTGDAPMESESAMLQRPGPWECRILKVGHHGSRSSTSETWLQATSPAWAIVSVGRGNRHGHPNPGVMALLHRSGAQPARTDREGTISFSWTERGLEREPALTSR